MMTTALHVGPMDTNPPSFNTYNYIKVSPFTPFYSTSNFLYPETHFLFNKL